MVFVLLQTDVGAAAAVALAALGVEGVLVADDVTGPYDVVVQAATAAVLTGLQAIPGVTRTLTLTPASTGSARAA